MDLRIGLVSTTCPRLSVQTIPRSDVVLADVVLLIRRVGDTVDFASYAPISVVGSVLLFQFDSLLFDGLYGRYQGTLSFNGTPYASLQFQYASDVSINPALQLSTIGPYIVCQPYAAPNWSGTGIGGPGTFIGLKDCPKTYAGSAGMYVRVRTLENGVEFVQSVVGIESLVAGDNITINDADPLNPIISSTGGGGGGGGQVNSIVGGSNIAVNSADPANPIVSGPIIFAVRGVTAAPSQNGIMCIYLGNIADNDFAGGIAYSLGGQWIDVASNSVLPIGT